MAGASRSQPLRQPQPALPLEGSPALEQGATARRPLRKARSAPPSVGAGPADAPLRALFTRGDTGPAAALFLSAPAWAPAAGAEPFATLRSAFEEPGGVAAAVAAVNAAALLGGPPLPRTSRWLDAGGGAAGGAAAPAGAAAAALGRAPGDYGPSSRDSAAWSSPGPFPFEVGVDEGAIAAVAAAAAEPAALAQSRTPPAPWMQLECPSDAGAALLPGAAVARWELHPN